MLKIFRYLALIAICVGIVWSFVRFDQPKFRYVYDSCQRKLIFDKNEDIDFLMVGGSRMMKAVRTDEFSKAVSINGEKRIAYDLARSWRSEFHSYVFLRDIYDRGRKVKNIVILFMGANRFRYHPHTHTIGKMSDIADLIMSSHDVPWTEKIQDDLSLNIKRASYHLEKWIDGTLYDESSDIRAMTEEDTDCTLTETYANTIIIDKRDKKLGKSTTGFTEWDYKEDKNKRVETYLKKIIELAMAHGTRVYLTLPIPFLKNALSSEFVKEVENTFGVPFLTPDQATLNTFFVAKNFGDESHMTPEGSILFSHWLAKEILKHEQTSK